MVCGGKVSPSIFSLCKWSHRIRCVAFQLILTDWLTDFCHFLSLRRANRYSPLSHFAFPIPIFIAASNLPPPRSTTMSLASKEKRTKGEENRGKRECCRSNSLNFHAYRVDRVRLNSNGGLHFNLNCSGESTWNQPIDICFNLILHCVTAQNGYVLTESIYNTKKDRADEMKRK